MKYTAVILALLLGGSIIVNAAVPPERTPSLDNLISWCAKLNPEALPELAHFKTSKTEVAVVWITKTSKKANSRVVTYQRSGANWILISDIEIYTNGMGLDAVQLSKEKTALLYMTSDGTTAHKQKLDQKIEEPE